MGFNEQWNTPERRAEEYRRNDATYGCLATLIIWGVIIFFCLGALAAAANWVMGLFNV